ncbi:MAG: glucose PTS transporter subunit IIA [Treponema sp.]|jgi:PTS system beta-glucosides-specific IIC component|nr:glucose PTS transporter subunit IIA [Treponema sp.]
MAKDFAKTAEGILCGVGGKNNVKNLVHCITRLRFTLYDQGKASDDAVKSAPGVLSVVKTGGLYQVIIGNDVFDVYGELKKLGVSTGGGMAMDNEGPKSKISPGSLANMLINTISGVFGPIIPALMGVGLIKGLITILELIFPAWAASGDTSHTILVAAGDALFYFLPIFTAMSASSKFGLEPAIGMTIAGALVYPNIVELYPFGPWGVQKFFGRDILVILRYSGTILPSIMAVYIASKLYKRLREILHPSIKNFISSFLTILIIVPLTFFVVGPLFGFTGLGIQMGIAKLIGIRYLGAVILGLLLGGFMQVLVIFGLHWAIVALAFIELSQVNPIWQSNVITTYPYTQIAALTQIGAVFAMAIKMRNPERRSAAVAAGISGIAGITEPILYGFTLPKKKPFVLSCVSGAVVCALAAFAGNFISGGYGIAGHMAGSGFFALPGYLIPGFSGSFMNFLIGLGASIFGIIGAFLLVLFTYKPDALDLRTGTETVIDTSRVDTARAKKIHSPVKGRVLPITQSADPAHQEESVGKGVCFMPLGGKIYAPFDGRVELVFDTKHAINIKSDDGIEALLHCGIDTVKLNGKGFTSHVQEGEKVRAGQLILEYNKDVIARAGFNLETQLVITNSGDYRAITQAKSGDCAVGDIILYVEE